MITTILFDLDGTLLPMDQELFIKTYFKALAARFAPLGYDPQKLINGVWKGTQAMVKNTGEQIRDNIPVFEDFEFYTTYENSRYCKPNPAYFQEILTHANVHPEECLMVGNDTAEDLAAATLGIQAFLLTDRLPDQPELHRHHPIPPRQLRHPDHLPGHPV